MAPLNENVALTMLFPQKKKKKTVERGKRKEGSPLVLNSINNTAKNQIVGLQV
jgi:hypothetical protein